MLFLIIFCETGLVVTPFLPGDSLIFTAGAIVATTLTLRVDRLFFILSLAAIARGFERYWIGFLMRSRVFRGKKIPFVKREYLERTHLFYKRHGERPLFWPDLFRLFVLLPLL